MNPVKPTCPSIDNCKKEIGDVISFLKQLSEDYEEELSEENIEMYIDALKDIGYGGFCLLEELRDQNSTLRANAEEMEDRVNELEGEISEMQIN